MSYQQATVPVPEKLAEAFSDALMEQGALCSTIEDAYAGTEQEQPIFGEPGMPAQQVWQQSQVTALFDTAADPAAALAAAAEQIGIALTEWRLEELEEQDWVRLTQSQFDPIQISPRLWITPTWHDSPDPAALNLRLDPGLAFGTGSHPTTRLCLRWLDQNLAGGERVLDYGCGSGILAIAAPKLGAGEAAGVDIDPQAVKAARANAGQNAVQAAFGTPDELPEGEQYDIVLANILANPLRMLGSMLAQRTKSGGRIVLSGILQEQAEELNAVYAEWFDMQPAVCDEGWVCLSGRKR